LVDSQPRERTVRTFDSYGRVATEQTERCSGTGCSWIVDSTAEHTYESRCQVQKITRAPGETEESTTEYGYDCNARLTAVWDANHPSPGAPSTAYHYDDLDRLTATVQGWEPSGAACVVDAASPDPDCLVTEYAYDAQDHLTSIVDGEGNETAYTYSDRDLLTSQVSNLSGTTSYEYNEHAELLETLDARSIATVREVDGADRVLSETFGSDPTLTTTYDYGETPAQFDVGRLVGITRNGETVAYAYDHFGRRTTDGALGFTYDKNGRRTTLTYPSGITATYGFDFADREASISADFGAGAVTLASGAKYTAQGPLRELTFGTSPARLEQRTFDLGLRPKTIAVDGSRLAWKYTLDGVRNVTAIAQTVPNSGSRTFDYQDFQYYLTQANGPWAPDRSWTYDRIGNRLTETVPFETTFYTYVQQPSGNTPLLESMSISAGGKDRTYTYDDAGNVVNITADANSIDFDVDATGQLATITRDNNYFADHLYDGRSFLSAVAAGESGKPPTEVLAATYASDGTLYTLPHEDDRATLTRTTFFHFAGRPIAQAVRVDAGTTTVRFLATDHLGTPLLALNTDGTTYWFGGFEPFGRDYQQGTANDALTLGLPLRLPGQWDHTIWEDATLGANLYYNVHRWNETGTGRYTQVDPLRSVPAFQQELPRPLDAEVFSALFAYAAGNPLSFIDPLGLLQYKGCSPDQQSVIGPAFDDYCSRAKGDDFKQCMCDKPSVPEGLGRLCGNPALTVRCKSDSGGSCSGNCAWSIPFGTTVRLCPGAFSGSTCGPLGCTLLHEMTHQLGHGGEKYPQQVEKCLGCSR